MEELKLRTKRRLKIKNNPIYREFCKNVRAKVVKEVKKYNNEKLQKVLGKGGGLMRRTEELKLGDVKS